MWDCSSVPYLSPRAAGQPDAWTEETTRAGQTGTQQIREVTEATPPPEVAEALRLQPSTTAVVRRRTMLLDGAPVELTDSWYPADIASGTQLAEPRRIKGGAVTFLAELGWVAAESLEDITFRPATGDEAEALGLLAGAPVIVLFRIALTAASVPSIGSKPRAFSLMKASVMPASS